MPATVPAKGVFAVLAVTVLAACSGPPTGHSATKLSATRPARPAVIDTRPASGGVTYTYCSQARFIGRRIAGYRGTPSRAQAARWHSAVEVLASITPGGESGQPHAAQVILAEYPVLLDMLFLKEGTAAAGWRAHARRLENACA